MDIHLILEWLIWIVDGFSVLVIIWGVIVASFMFFKSEFNKKGATDKMVSRQLIRAKLGSYILLGLEILIAADIIGTIANPSINEIVLLAVTVLIRTFISFFLNREIKEAQELAQE